MTISTLTAYTTVTNPSNATTGLLNYRFGVVHKNLDQLNTDAGGLSLLSFSGNTVSFGTYAISASTSSFLGALIPALSVGTLTVFSGQTIYSTSHWSMGNKRMEMLGEPSGTSDAATKHYVDAMTASATLLYGTESQVSAKANGVGMFTSDSSRFFGVPSGGTVLIGGVSTVLEGMFPSAVIGVAGTPPQTFYWASETSVIRNAADGQSVLYPNSGFSDTPAVFVSVSSSRLTNAVGYLTATVTNSLPSGFSVRIYFTSGTPAIVATSVVSLHWHAIGPRVL